MFQMIRIKAKQKSILTFPMWVSFSAVAASLPAEQNKMSNCTV